jgi:hypothetical protein
VLNNPSTSNKLLIYFIPGKLFWILVQEVERFISQFKESWVKIDSLAYAFLNNVPAIF